MPKRSSCTRRSCARWETVDADGNKVQPEGCHDPRSHADRADPAAEPERAVQPGQSHVDQEERLRRDRRGVPPLRPEGVRDLRRPADGARLRPGGQGGPVVRQGRPDHSGQQVGADRQDPGRSEGVRAAVPGRADHRRRALQQGGGRVVALHRRGGVGHDEGDQQAGGRHADQLGLDDERTPARAAALPRCASSPACGA